MRKSLHVLFFAWNLCVLLVAFALIMLRDNAWWALLVVFISWPDDFDCEGIAASVRNMFKRRSKNTDIPPRSG